jgi:hypothetical protein
MQGAPVPTPRQYLHFYSANEWEEFTVEWVRALKHPYVLVTPLGGAGDRGADVAACLSRQGTNGEWHCYQCKHYEEPLRPSDAWTEIVKIFAAKVEGFYNLPTRYIFVAPKISPYLTRYLANPKQLKAEFIKAWEKEDTKLGIGLDPEIRVAVDTLTRDTDFSMFEAPNFEWIIELHSTTSNHARRFMTTLKPRPAVMQPPSDEGARETLYVHKLLDAYNEKHGIGVRSLQEARDHPKIKGNLARQREAFYSAESLRVFARDSVPEGTYGAIESDLYHAVVDIEERDYENGYDRLEAVLIAAANFAPNAANILAPIVTVPDRKGMCHQLANDDRLTWCKGESQ